MNLSLISHKVERKTQGDLQFTQYGMGQNVKKPLRSSCNTGETPTTSDYILFGQRGKSRWEQCSKCVSVQTCRINFNH
jgi:hypothetical protein